MFDKSDGLADRAHDVYEDKDKHIWFGTAEGVQKYDGLRWTTYTVEDGLVHNKVSAVIQAHDGAMWFGTDQSVLRFDDTDWTLAGTCRIERIFEASDGSIWAASRNPNEVLRFDPSASSSLRQGSGRQAGQAYGYRRRGGASGLSARCGWEPHTT